MAVTSMNIGRTAAPLRPATASNTPVLNVFTSNPQFVVPSGNTSIETPLSIRSFISAISRCVADGRLRSTRSIPYVRQTQPSTGQLAMLAFPAKHTGICDPISTGSRAVRWLLTQSMARCSGISPVAVTLMPRIRQTFRAHVICRRTRKAARRCAASRRAAADVRSVKDTTTRKITIARYQARMRPLGYPGVQSAIATARSNVPLVTLQLCRLSWTGFAVAGKHNARDKCTVQKLYFR